MPGVMQELQEIRALAREFAQAELRPNVERWDHERRIDDTVRAHVAELGFFGMVVSEEFGGMGFDAAAYLTVLEQLAWGEPAVALLVAQNALAATAIQQQGSDAQKQQWLAALARGEAAACFALAEEQAGSDLLASVAKATRQNSDVLLEGRKAWVSNASQAQLAFVLARLDDKPAIWLVPRSDAWQIGPREQTLGLRALEVSAVNFNGVRLPLDAQLSGADAAALAAAPTGDLGRLSIAAISVGIAQAALDHALGYADQREQFGRKLRSFEGLQYKLADMATQTEAARALLEQAARAGESRSAAMAKLFASEAAMWVTTQAVQIFGGYGYMRDYPVEKLMRDAKAMALLEGANEMQRIFIAEASYQDPT